MNTGDFGAALGAARSIPDAEVRDRTQRQRAELQSLNGGNGAQFQQLIDLIQENTEGPWEDIDGIGGTTTWEPNGVRVDPLGLLARLTTREQTGRLDALGVRSRQADLQEDMAQPSELRMVSLTRLERAVSERLASGQPVVESMLRLAGLTEVHYVFVYPDAGEVVIAGPAEGWKYTANGDTVGTESEHPTLQLDDLVTVLRTFSPEGEGFRMLNQPASGWTQRPQAIRRDLAVERTAGLPSHQPLGQNARRKARPAGYRDLRGPR
ncbi:MAG: hypothetical protein R3B91_10320 [Planctomycetaceae bacterium]